MGSERTVPKSKACPQAPTVGKKQMLTADGRWLLGMPQPPANPWAPREGCLHSWGNQGPLTLPIALDLHNSQVPCQTTNILRFLKEKRY